MPAEKDDQPPAGDAEDRIVEHLPKAPGVRAEFTVEDLGGVDYVVLRDRFGGKGGAYGDGAYAAPVELLDAYIEVFQRIKARLAAR